MRSRSLEAGDDLHEKKIGTCSYETNQNISNKHMNFSAVVLQMQKQCLKMNGNAWSYNSKPIKKPERLK